MRFLIVASAVATLLLTAPAATAAPTCQDRNGDTIRCGTPGAMPVAWSLTPQQLMDRRTSRSIPPSLDQLFGLFCVIGGFFALVLLMPRFDGDWDEQEGGDEERR